MQRYDRILLLLALVLAPALPARSQSTATSTPAAVARLLGRLAPSAARPSDLRHETVLHQRWDGTRWIEQGRRIYVYEAGERREEWTFERHGEAILNETRTTYQTIGGQPYEQLVEVWDTTRSDFSPSARYAYDVTYAPETGAPIVGSRRYQQWTGAEWADRERSTFTVAPGDAPYYTGGQTDYWDGTAWVPLERYALVEAEGGVVETTERWDGFGWQSAERAIYPGRTIPGLNESVRRLQAELDGYPDLNRAFRLVPDHVRQQWQDGAWVNADRQVTQLYHMLSGEPARMVYEVWDGDAWIAESGRHVSYEGTAHGYQPSSTTLDVPEGDLWLPTFVESYVYGDDGLLVRSEQQVRVGNALVDTDWYSYIWRDVNVGVEDEPVPAGFALSPAYPNPFNPQTRLSYHLPASARVAVRVFDVLGRQVAVLADGVQAAGRHEVTFEAGNLAGGVYLVRFDAPGFHQTRKVTLVK